MIFLLKRYLNFAKKEENSHESRRKLTLKIIFFFKLFKINDHKKYHNLRFAFVKKRKQNQNTLVDFCRNYQKNDKKNHVTSVFVSYYFSMFLKNMAMRLS